MHRNCKAGVESAKWRAVVDGCLGNLLNGHIPSLQERERLARAAIVATRTVPATEFAQDLYRFVVREHIGVINRLDLPPPVFDDLNSGCPDLFTIGRAGYICPKHCQSRQISKHRIAVATCVALHEADRARALDGVFSLAVLGVSGYDLDDDLRRFFDQAVTHLQVLMRCFPEPDLERVLEWATQIPCTMYGREKPT